MARTIRMALATAAVLCLAATAQASTAARGRMELPVGTTPRSVVMAYVAALNSHNVSAARALLTPAHAREVATETDGWFTNVRSITHLRLDPVRRDAIDARRLQYRFAVLVPVEFVLDQYRIASMLNGPTVWEYILVHNSRAAPWRIGDEGSG